MAISIATYDTQLELSSINDTSQTTEDILKAAKKKAPDASKSPNHQADLEVKDMYTLAIARPVAPEIKPAEGGLPPPPAKPKCPASPPSPKRHSSTSSTEQLIPSPGYKTLRPINKIDEVKTIKRQTKTGWL
ncbi:hypothetical protein RR48_03867 [Papilio machaon]|uniref:Uncharacterized protein n=1 Tax=Papilio machaon TaxID=76193 RepID=A0A0N0PDM3_PAPMA|nr:hypothetical protein RR48_03867 [Papilio machaon]